MAIQKEAPCGEWTPWTPFCRRSMEPSQPDVPQPNWQGYGRNDDISDGGAGWPAAKAPADDQPRENEMQSRWQQRGSVQCDSASEMMAEALKWVPPKQALEPAHDCSVADSAAGSERATDEDAASSRCPSLDAPAYTALPASPVFRLLHRMWETSGDLFIDPCELRPGSELGEGSFATVEECVLRGERVAVKRLRTELVSNLDEVECFLAEGMTVSKLDHPCVVRLVGLGFAPGPVQDTVQNDSLLMAQELCRGGSLRDLVAEQMVCRREVLYTHTDALRWAMQMAEGLAYLHERSPQIIHRDLKLDNILLGGSPACWAAKIADFGVSAIVKPRRRKQSMDSNGRRSLGRDSLSSLKSARSGGERTKELKQTSRHNLTGQTGSFLSMAPEVVLKQPYNEKADIFSLGCCLFEMFSRSLMSAGIPATGDPHECRKIAYKVADGYRQPLPMQWPQALRDIIVDCMQQECSFRPTARQVAERLSSPRMHALVTAMDGYEAHVRAVVHGEGDKVPRGGCGIAQLLRRKQKRNDRSSAHAPVVQPRS